MTGTEDNRDIQKKCLTIIDYFTKLPIRQQSEDIWMQTIPIYNLRNIKKTEKSCCAPSNITVDGSNAQQTMPISANTQNQSWISGVINSSSGPVPVVTPEWSRTDIWGRIRSRIGSFRMNYSINPGLYAIGTPDANSDVFVSANYKLSFDILRRELGGLNSWILVLDTKGINVWCAAGKGTFGTDELVKQILSANLATIVSHKRIIAPQLGAVGVKASEIKKRTGFIVSFGPVEAEDIKKYLRSNYKASAEMRNVKFQLIRRIVLTPMELNPALKKYPLIGLVILSLFGLEPSGIIFRNAWTGGWPFLMLVLTGIFTGAFITPVLLPVIPFRSFALKGVITGLIAAIPIVFFTPVFGNDPVYLKISAGLITVILSSYLALQFTGATTFTGISGVKKELKFALPLYIIGLAVTVVLIIIHKIILWNII
jgi:hypothetical protein